MRDSSLLDTLRRLRLRGPPVASITVSALLVLVALIRPWNDLGLGLPLEGDVAPPSRWITHVVAHASLAHLASNMLVVPFVYVAERAQGTARTALAGAVAGGTAAAWMRRAVDEPLMLLGFSGCGYGVIGFLLAFVLLNMDEFRRPLAWATACIAYVCTEFTVAQVLTEIGGARIAHMAHLVGAWQGVCCGLAFGRNVTVRPHERALRIGGSIGLVAAASAALV